MNRVLLFMVLTVASAGCAVIQLSRPFKPQPDDWTTLGGNAARENLCSSPVKPPFKELWQYNAQAGISASPLVRDSVVVVGTLQGELQAIDMSVGRRLGYITLGAAVAGTPAMDRTVVYVPIELKDETLVAYDVKDGERRWSIRVGPIESSPLLLDGHVYVTTLGGSLVCVSQEDGDELWRYTPQAKEERKPIRSSPSTDGNLIFFGSDDGTVYAVDHNKSELHWKRQTNASVFASPIVVKGAVVVGSLDGILYCLDANDGRIRWTFDTHSKIFNAVSTDSSTVFLGTPDGTLRAIDAESGNLRWNLDVPTVLYSPPLVAGDLLYVGGYDKLLRVVDKRTGKEVGQYVAPGRIKVTPVIWGSTLIVVAEDKYVIALREDHQ